MKHLSRLKLNALAESRLAEREMNALRGGECICGCGCLYADSGGADIMTNYTSNIANRYHSSWNYYVYCDGELWQPEGGVDWPENGDWD